MQISKIMTGHVSFSSKDYSKREEKSVPKAEKNDVFSDKYIDKVHGVVSIFSYKETEDLNKFAYKNKAKNVVMKIIATPLGDCKYIKTQKDFNNNTGKWLDITDWSEF